jgi:hypothetical protein
MRPSVFATLVFIGLIGIGIRAQTLSTNAAPRTEPVMRHGKVLKPAPPPAPVPELTVDGPWSLTPEEAKEGALLRAQERLAAWVQSEYPLLKYAPPTDYINDHLVKSRREETFQEARDKATSLETARGAEAESIGVLLTGRRRVCLDLQLTSDFQTQVRRLDRDQRVGQRMSVLGALLGLGVLGLGSLGAYIRLDDWTRGYYTNRLRLGALAVVGAGVVALLVLA